MQKQRGLDFIKVYDNLSSEAYFALMDEAKKLNIPVAGHVPVAVRASDAAEAGQVSIEHCCAGSLYEQCSLREDEIRPLIIKEVRSDEPKVVPLIQQMIDTYSAEKCEGVINSFVENGTWFVPTLMVESQHEGWLDDPRVRFLPPSELRYFKLDMEMDEQLFGTEEQRQNMFKQNNRLLKAMREAGVRMLAGSDPGISGVFFGSSLSEELELLVEAGFTKLEALRMATLYPAEFLGLTQDYGAVEVGKIADLVLLNSNPLVDIRGTKDIQMVILNGRPLDSDDLQTLRIQAEEAAQSME